MDGKKSGKWINVNGDEKNCSWKSEIQTILRVYD